MPTITYDGMNCEVVLDTEAGTVTLTHGGGITVPKHKKESSPWVIPLGAITDIEFQEKSMMARGWVRILVVDGVGWSKNHLEDVNAFFAGKDKVTLFVEAINTRPGRCGAGNDARTAVRDADAAVASRSRGNQGHKQVPQHSG